MKRCLFLCSTIYQLIVAITIKMSMEKDSIADIIITDEIKDGRELSKRLKKSTDIFRHVVYIEGKNTVLEKGKELYIPPLMDKKVGEVGAFFPKIRKKMPYTDLFFANIGGINMRLAYYLAGRNRKVHIHMYEEGISSYSNIFGIHINYNGTSAADNLKHKLMFGILDRVESFYFFKPEMVIWTPTIKLKRIPPISKNNEVLKKILNEVFDYGSIMDNYEEKVIFFEESYYGDGIEVKDVELVSRLSEKFGKENIFVKSHPRNPTNRFEELGYNVNKDKIIPWEVIALNINTDDKVLVTMTSTAVMNSFILFNTKADLIMEYGDIRNIGNERIDMTIEAIENARRIYPDAFNELF